MFDGSSTHSHHNFNYIPLAFVAYSYSDQHRLALLPSEDTRADGFTHGVEKHKRNKIIPQFTQDISSYIRRICRNQKTRTTTKKVYGGDCYDVGILSAIPRRNYENILYSKTKQSQLICTTRKNNVFFFFARFQFLAKKFSIRT